MLLCIWPFGFHELSCPGQGRLISRHNALRDCLYSVGQQAGLSVRREPQNLFQYDLGDKPADVLFGLFYHGRDVCVDVTIVNLFTDIHKKTRDPVSFLQSAVTHKRQNYADRDRCRAAGKLYAVWAVEVEVGIYLPEMKCVLKRIHRGISENLDITISVFRSRSCYSISLLPLVVADSASSFLNK